MTRKDYRLIAAAIQTARNAAMAQYARDAQADEIIRHVADALASDNAAFSRSMFRNACRPDWAVALDGVTP